MERNILIDRAAIALAFLCASCVAGEDCLTAECALTGDEHALLLELAGLGPAPRDASNRLIGDAAAIALGKKFFFDPGFSGKATLLDALRRDVPYGAHGTARGEQTRLSCASCHDLSRAGADTRSVPNHISVGTGWSAVNARSILNAAHHRMPFWNAREDSLWGMIPPVAESGLAMGGNRARIAARIYDHYRAEYSAIFGDPQIFGACRAIIPPDGLPGRMSGCQSDADGPWNDAFDCIDTCTEAQVDGEAVRRAITEMLVNYAKAIAAYEHELVTKSSRFDRFMLEGGRLEASEIRGARLFAGKAACIDCHHTPLFSDDRYYNTGVPEVGTAIPTEADCPEGHPVCDCTKGQNCLPFGYYDGLTKLKNSKYHRTGTWSDDPSDDSRAELYALAPTEEMKGAWRTPTLRDVALTAPYMHNGSLATLEEVIDFYDAGGSSLGTQPAYKSVKMQPLGLSVEEKADLAAFLRALTSDPLSEELISAPAVPPLD